MSGFPASRQSFRLPANATVFTIGSCFARNIEEHLSLIGCKVPTLSFSVPKSEWRARPNGILNKYTPATIYQEVSWAHKAYQAGGVTAEDCQEMRWDLPDGSVIDLQLGGNVPVSEERFLERRFQVYELFCSAFSADCVTITLGLIESWRDRRTGLYIQSAPVARSLLRNAEDFEFALLDYNDCLNSVTSTIEKVRELNPGSRILVTTSPVPMEKTFTEEDVIVANMTSKSILRAVANQVTTLFEGVDYFPSYEAVVMSDRSEVFNKDNLHVRNDFVGSIAQNLVSCYFEAPEELNQLIQQVAADLASKSCGYAALRELLARKPKFDELTTDQLIIYLRACWRLRARWRVRRIASELMKRRDRNSRHVGAVKHIFPKVGRTGDARRYAEELLLQDPSNPLAREILDEA